MTAELIKVDFKNRQVLYREHKVEVPTIDIAGNKRLINDLKAMLDDVATQVDLYGAILLIPGEPSDLFTKVNGTDMTAADVQAVERIYQKMRQANVAG